MQILFISSAHDSPGVILAGLGTDIWFMTLADAKAYARHALHLTGGRVEMRDDFGNVADWSDFPPAEDDGLGLF
ncbi:MAG: hypothetical protein JO076_12290 [Verrucomicrobia bacterium]|nr:hypothetical protein [Verrucomicrobiota bacterium]